MENEDPPKECALYAPHKAFTDPCDTAHVRRNSCVATRKVVRSNISIEMAGGVAVKVTAVEYSVIKMASEKKPIMLNRGPQVTVVEQRLIFVSNPCDNEDTVKFENSNASKRIIPVSLELEKLPV